MDKRIQATEKIQAQVLEPFFVVYVSIATFVPLSFSSGYACVSLISMQHSNGNGLCSSGWDKVQSRLAQELKLLRNQGKKLLHANV